MEKTTRARMVPECSRTIKDGIDVPETLLLPPPPLETILQDVW